MARNISAIKQRITSVGSTRKITNAMRLVSMSKLQQFKRKQDRLAPYFNEVAKVSNRFGKSQDTEKKLLYIVFAPDLGLVSAFTNGLIDYISKLPKGDLLWVGSQGYDVAMDHGLHVINKMMSSEDIELDDFIEDTNRYLLEYEINLIIPSYGGGSMALGFAVEELNVYLKNDNDVVYYPNHKEAAQRFREIVMKAMIYYQYYASKYSEYTTRRIAMETATQNADDMIEDLQIVYNRLRQEAITQEIAEIVSGMDAQSSDAKIEIDTGPMTFVSVVSAKELNEDSKESIIKMVKTKYPEPLQITYDVDSKLMAGFVIRVDNDIYDTSLKSKLDQMKDLKV